MTALKPVSDTALIADISRPARRRPDQRMISRPAAGDLLWNNRRSFVTVDPLTKTVSDTGFTKRE